MNEFLSQLAKREWFIDGVGVIVLLIPIILLIVFISKQMGLHLNEFFHYFKNEMKDFINKDLTVGAVNFACIIVLTLFGALVIFAVEFKTVLGFIASYVGISKADFFSKSANFNTLFYVLAIVMVTSVITVAIHSKSK